MHLLKDDWNWIAGGATASATIVIAIFGLHMEPLVTAAAAIVAFAAVTTGMGPLNASKQITLVEHSLPPAQELLSRAEMLNRKLRKLLTSPIDPETLALIGKLSSTLNRTLDHIADAPEKVLEVRRLITYYLPNAVSLGETYVDIYLSSPSSERLEDIRDGLTTLDQAFTHFAEVAVDKTGTLTVDLKLLKDAVREDMKS